MRKAIKKQEHEIANLQDDVNYLLKLGEWQKAVEKQQRIELLERQIELVKEL